MNFYDNLSSNPCHFDFENPFLRIPSSLSRIINFSLTHQMQHLATKYVQVITLPSLCLPYLSHFSPACLQLLLTLIFAAPCIDIICLYTPAANKDNFEVTRRRTLNFEFIVPLSTLPANYSCLNLIAGLSVSLLCIRVQFIVTACTLLLKFDYAYHLVTTYCLSRREGNAWQDKVECDDKSTIIIISSEQKQVKRVLGKSEMKSK